MYEILSVLADVGRARQQHLREALGTWIQYTLHDLNYFGLAERDEDGFFRITELGRYYIHHVPRKYLLFVNFERIRRGKEIVEKLKKERGTPRRCTFCGRLDKNYLEFDYKQIIICRNCLLKLKSVKKLYR